MENKEYPLFPELPEAAQEQARELMERFKVGLLRIAEDVMLDLYADVVPYIESDTWSNFRNEIMDGFKNYKNRKIQAEYDFAEIRQAILKHHRADIIEDLDQDMVKEIADLKRQIELMQERRY